MKSTTPMTSPVSSSEFGQPFTHDPEFHGPVKQRSCTDVICLFLFVSFIAGWVIISSFAFKYGDPRTLLYPTDSLGRKCGLGELESKPYLYFFDLTKCANVKVLISGCKTPQVCVSHCPNQTVFFSPYGIGEDDKSKLICKEGTDMNKKASDLIIDGDCASLYLESKPLLGRCIPYRLLSEGGIIVDFRNETIDVSKNTIIRATEFLAKFLNAKEIGKQIFSDFKSSWHLITIGLVLSALVAFFWVVLMRWVAGVMVWLSIVLVILLCAYVCYYSVTMYIQVKQRHGGADDAVMFTTNLSSYRDNTNTWLAFAIISGSLLLILLLVLIFLRKRIKIAIALIKEGSKAVGKMFSTLLFPIFPYVLELAVFIYWGAVALYLASSGKATFVVSNATATSPFKNHSICDPHTFNTSYGECLFSNYGESQNLYPGQIYNLFAMLWSVFFFIGVGQVSLAGAFAAYYWTLDKREVPSCAIVVGVYRCLRFHLGSVAFGSLLIATVRFIRIVLEYIDAKLKKYDNQVTRIIMWCMKCCFWLLEKFLKFISKNAYIMMAVYGKNFCASAKIAFELLLRNVLRVVVLDKVTDFLLFIGKLVIVGVAAAASFYMFTGRVEYLNQYVPPLNYNLLPVFVITFGAYIIASLFFNVYGMAVDTLFLCFLEDCERNDGSPEKPYYMSKELMKILDKRNKFRDPR